MYLGSPTVKLFAYNCDHKNCNNNNNYTNNNLEENQKKMNGDCNHNQKLLAIKEYKNKKAGGGGVKMSGSDDFPRAEVRHEEVLALKTKFPTKVPIIIQRYAKEVQLPHLDKSKYLVPQEITMSQFQTIIRNRMQLGPNQALYLLVNKRSMMSLSLTMAQIYSEHAGPDGFLYVTYASQEVFGGGQGAP